MATRKPLVIGPSGKPEELQSGDNIVDPSPQKATYTSGEALGNRKVVYSSGADEASLAKADADGTMDAIGFTLSAVGSAASVEVQHRGLVDGFTGLTPGAEYFVDPAVAGEITTTPPTGAGKIVQYVGFAKNATEIVADFRTGIKRG